MLRLLPHFGGTPGPGLPLIDAIFLPSVAPAPLLTPAFLSPEPDGPPPACIPCWHQILKLPALMLLQSSPCLLKWGSVPHSGFLMFSPPTTATLVLVLGSVKRIPEKKLQRLLPNCGPSQLGKGPLTLSPQMGVQHRKCLLDFWLGYGGW